MITGILIGDGVSRKNLWQVQKFKDKPILLHTIEALQNSALDEVVLVLGRNYHQILNKVKFDQKKIKLVLNRKFERGLSSYLKTGLQAVSDGTAAIMVVKGEYPMIKSSLIDRMVEFYIKDKSEILVPVFEEETGQPFIMSNQYFKHLFKLKGDDLGESLISRYSREVAKLSVENPGVVKGIDKIAELESLDTVEIERKEKEAATQDQPVPSPEKETMLKTAQAQAQAKEQAKIEAEEQQKKEMLRRKEELVAKSREKTREIRKSAEIPIRRRVLPPSGKTESVSMERTIQELESMQRKEKTPPPPRPGSSRDLSLKMLSELMEKGTRKNEPRK